VATARPSQRLLEPRRLAAGKQFDDEAKRVYLDGSSFTAERRLRKPNLRLGRADLLLIDGKTQFAAIAELKDTDWEGVNQRGTLARNVSRHARQVWSYLDATLERDSSLDLVRVERYAALVYRRAPRPTLKTVVEDAFGEHGVSVVWMDEPPPEDSPAFRPWLRVFGRGATRP
jgi:hypothetical protein